MIEAGLLPPQLVVAMLAKNDHAIDNCGGDDDDDDGDGDDDADSQVDADGEDGDCTVLVAPGSDCGYDGDHVQAPRLYHVSWQNPESSALNPTRMSPKKEHRSRCWMSPPANFSNSEAKAWKVRLLES